MRLRIISPTGETSERVVETARARLGRDPACEVAFDAAAYPKVSGEHAHIERTASGLILTPRSQSNKTLLNDQPIDRPAALKVGDRIGLGFTGPTIEILTDEVPRPKSPAPLSPAPGTKPAPGTRPAVRTGLSAAEGRVARSTSSGPVSNAGGRLYTVKLVLEVVAVLVTIIGGIIGIIAGIWGLK